MNSTSCHDNPLATTFGTEGAEWHWQDGGGVAGTAAAVSAARKGLNICNLFMAGRDISVTREALGAVRMIRTTGMMGKFVGKAAWICVRHDTTPRGVYQKHLPLLKKLMEQPGAMRRKPLDAALAPPPC